MQKKFLQTLGLSLVLACSLHAAPAQAKPIPASPPPEWCLPQALSLDSFHSAIGTMKRENSISVTVNVGSDTAYLVLVYPHSAHDLTSGPIQAYLSKLTSIELSWKGERCEISFPGTTTPPSDLSFMLVQKEG